MVEQERSRPRRATLLRVPRRVLEDGRHALVGLVDGRSKLPCARFGILEQLGEARVR
jgi:hypothetical protein